MRQMEGSVHWRQRPSAVIRAYTYKTVSPVFILFHPLILISSCSGSPPSGAALLGRRGQRQGRRTVHRLCTLPPAVRFRVRRSPARRGGFAEPRLGAQPAQRCRRALDVPRRVDGNAAPARGGSWRKLPRRSGQLGLAGRQVPCRGGPHRGLNAALDRQVGGSRVSR